MEETSTTTMKTPQQYPEIIVMIVKEVVLIEL